MAKRTVKSIEENLIAGIKQAVIDIDADEKDAYMCFLNQGRKFYLLNMIGSHALLYCPADDLIVLVWGLRVKKDICEELPVCSWGNGTYFNADYPSNNRYDWETISRYIIDRI